VLVLDVDFGYVRLRLQRRGGGFDRFVGVAGLRGVEVDRIAGRRLDFGDEAAALARLSIEQA
jgi:hypothetical protein